MKPGATIMPEASSTRAASFASRRPTRAILPSLMPTSPRKRGILEPSTIIPPFMMVSKAGIGCSPLLGLVLACKSAGTSLSNHCQVLYHQMYRSAQRCFRRGDNTMAEFDCVIRGGTIVDGTLTPPFKADLGIKHGRIARIGYLKRGDGTQTLDAGGLIVAPGAIDLHCHYDAPVFWDPACSIGSWHGVTSVTNGNCGFGFAPVHAKDADRAMLSMERNEAIPYASMKATMPFTWETFPQWMDHLERLPKAVNMMQLVPVTPLVSYVMGGWDQAKSRQPNEKEVGRMVEILDEAMASGANGWAAQRLAGRFSTQRDYDGSLMISDLMPDEFYLSLARGLRKYDRGHIQYAQTLGGRGSRDPVEGPRRDIDFGGQLAQASNRPVIYNGIVPNSTNPDVFRAQARVVDEYNRRGVALVGHAVTVRLKMRCSFREDWTFFDNVDEWREALMGPFEERWARLQEPARRERLRYIYDRSRQPITAGDIANFICRKLRATICAPDTRTAPSAISRAPKTSML